MTDTPAAQIATQAATWAGRPSRRLRSTTVRGALLGMSAFALTACEEPVDLTFFTDLDQCKAAAAESTEFSAGDCNRAFEQALAEHAVLAPRYDELPLCQEQHGPDACAPTEVAGGVPDEVAADEVVAVELAAGEVAGEAAPGDTETAGGGASFMPFFMGYMMGNALGSNTPGGYAGRPVYADTKGQVFNTDGRRMAFAGAGSTVRGVPSTVRQPAVMKPVAPMTRAVVSARGGFGAARAASFGG